jgi:hypothetical protein
LGDNDPAKIERHAPLAIQRLRNPATFGSRQHENESAVPRPLVETGVRTEEDDASDTSDGIGEQFDINGAVFVNSLSYSDFRDRLIVHFDILWRRHRIVWPRSKENNQYAN